MYQLLLSSVVLREVANMILYKRQIWGIMSTPPGTGSSPSSFSLELSPVCVLLESQY